MRRALLTPLLLALAVAARDARGEMPELWRWIDADGIPRYTPDPDYVPSAQRGTLVRVEPGMVKAPEPAHEVKPAAIFVPPGEPPLEADPFNAPAPARVETEIVAPVPLEAPPRAAEAPATATPTASTAPAVSAPASSASAPALTESPPVPEVPAPAVAARPAPVSAPRTAAPAPSAATPAAEPSQVVPIKGIEPEEVSLDTPPPAPEPPAAPAGATLPAVGAVAPGAPEASSAPAAAPLPPELEARRAELVAAIARDEELLKAHVSAGSDEPLTGTPELREIAQRLPALQAELRALEAKRGTP